MLLISTLLIGCAAQKPLTREEALKQREILAATTVRVYSDTSQEEVLKATEKILLLADGSDFKITHTKNAVIGNRLWSYYFVIGYVIGWDKWLVVAEKNGKDTTVGIRIYQDVQGFPMVAREPSMGGTGADWSIATLPSIENTYPGKAIYELFFRRLDYFLGKSKKWTNCESAALLVEEKKIDGDLTPLCDQITIKDDKPEI